METVFRASTYVFILVCLLDFGMALRNAIKIKKARNILLPLALAEMFVSLNVASVNIAVLWLDRLSPGDLHISILFMYRMSFITLFIALIARRYFDLKLWKVEP